MSVFVSHLSDLHLSKADLYVYTLYSIYLYSPLKLQFSLLFFKEKFMFFLNSLLATKWRVCVSNLHSTHTPHSPNRLKKKRKKRVVAASDIDTCNAGGISRSRSKLQRGMLHVARCKLQAHLIIIIIALCICPLWFNEL